MSRKRTPPRGIEELRDLSAKAANLFREKGVGPGDVVAGLLPRTVELMTVILGAWRLGAVYQPLLVKACGSPRLLSIRNLLYDQSDRYQRIAAQTRLLKEILRANIWKSAMRHLPVMPGLRTAQGPISGALQKSRSDRWVFPSLTAKSRPGGMNTVVVAGPIHQSGIDLLRSCDSIAISMVSHPAGASWQCSLRVPFSGMPG